MRSRRASGSMPSCSANWSIVCSRPKRAGRIAGRAHGAARSGIDEHVVLGAVEIGTGIKRLCIVADAGAERDACRAVAYERNRRERAVALGADAQSLPCAWPIAGIHLFLFAIEEQPHRRLCAARQFDGDAAVIAERRFGAKTAAHRVDDDADAVERQAERLRDFLPHAGGELCRHVDGQPFGAPIGNDRVRFEAAMRLHLGAVFAFDDDIGFGKAFATSPRLATAGPRTLPFNGKSAAAG